MWPTLPPMGHDLFRTGGGLGVQAYELLSVLDTREGQDAKHLAHLTGLKVDLVRTKLRRMAQLGLCRRDDDGHWRLLAFDADDAAVMAGTSGKQKRQRERFQAESFIRAAEVETWKASRADAVRDADMAASVEATCTGGRGRASRDRGGV